MKLVTISIETFLKATYQFPDMGEPEIVEALSRLNSASGNLTLVNASQAVIVVPLRIIRVVSVDGCEVFARDQNGNITRWAPQP